MKWKCEFCKHYEEEGKYYKQPCEYGYKVYLECQVLKKVKLFKPIKQNKIRKEQPNRKIIFLNNIKE